MKASPFSEDLIMFKDRQFDRSVILLCVRWHLADGLSLRDLKEMMAERGIGIDTSTIHRWVVHFAPLLLERFNRRKRAVTDKWHIDETYIKVRGRWMYLYRAIDSVGDTVVYSSARTVTCMLQNASFAKPWSAMGVRNALSLTAARRTARQSLPVTVRTGYGIDRNGH